MTSENSRNGRLFFYALGRFLLSRFFMSDTPFRAPFRVPPYARRRIRQNSRVGSCRMRSCGGGGICGDAALRKKSPFSDRRSVLSSFGKNANGGGRGAFPVKNIVFSGRKTGIRKKETERRHALFSKLFSLYGSLVQRELSAVWQTEGLSALFRRRRGGKIERRAREFRKEKRRCKRIAFANGFSGGYSSMPSKMPPVSRSFQSISPSCRRIYEWGESSLGRETEPQLT